LKISHGARNDGATSDNASFDGMTRQRTPDRAPGATNVSEWDARAYHTVSEPQFEWGKHVLGTLQLSGDERVLDAGCGTARLTALLVERLPHGHVVALDRSFSMAAVATSTLSGFQDQAAVVLADLIELPFVDAFDVVFSTATFHWVLDHDRLFANLSGALRPGGRLQAQCGGRTNLARFLERANELAHQPEYAAEFAGWTRPSNFATADDTRARLLHAGFVDVDAWQEHAPVTFANADAFRAFVKTVVLRPYLPRIAGEERRAAFVDRLVGDAAHDDPPYTLDYCRLNMTARRP
jgi:trans-aconitate 2-methyltransferase